MIFEQYSISLKLFMIIFDSSNGAHLIKTSQELTTGFAVIVNNHVWLTENILVTPTSTWTPWISILQFVWEIEPVGEGVSSSMSWKFLNNILILFPMIGCFS